MENRCFWITQPHSGFVNVDLEPAPILAFPLIGDGPPPNTTITAEVVLEQITLAPGPREISMSTTLLPDARPVVRTGSRLTGDAQRDTWMHYAYVPLRGLRIGTAGWYRISIALLSNEFAWINSFNGRSPTTSNRFYINGGSPRGVFSRHI